MSENIDNVITIKNLYKSYGSVKAVQDLSFMVKRGELFAFLGVNGAGKSTTISMICGQLAKDSGTITVLGKDVEKDFDSISRKIGVVFQSSILDKKLSVKDNLKSRATLYGINGKDFENRLNELTNMFDLKDLLDRQLEKLSGGQRRRVDIARALLHDPEILILDEPTTGLDPQTRQLLWNSIYKLRKENGLTVFLTTHYMEEAADADYIIILDSGKIVAEGTPLSLKNSYAGDYVVIYNSNDETIKSLGLPYTKIRDAYKIKVSNTKEVTDLIVKNPDVFTDYEVTKGKIDDVFIEVTGKVLQGGNQ